MTSFNVPLIPFQQFTDISRGYSRDYSCVTKILIDDFTEEEAIRRKEAVLEFPKNKVSFSKVDTYVKAVTNTKSREYANETNANTHNFIRVDADGDIMNQQNTLDIPYLTTPVPLLSQINKYDFGMPGTNIWKASRSEDDNTTIVIPIVNNMPRENPVNSAIPLFGGKLLGDLLFDPTVDPQLQNPREYVDTTKEIIPEEEAIIFNIDVTQTYTEEDIQKAEKQSIIEAYPEVATWDRDEFITSTNNQAIMYGQEQPPFLPSTYIAGDFTPSGEAYAFTTFRYIEYIDGRGPDDYVIG